MQNTYMYCKLLEIMCIILDISSLFYKNRLFEELKMHICSYKTQFAENKPL